MSNIKESPTAPSPKTVHAASSGEVVEEKTVPQKKICCACPDTKKQRDECVVLKGEPACKAFIEAHKVCLRKEGFDV